MASQPETKHLLFVINPISGDVDKEELELDIYEFGIENNITYELYHTTGLDDEAHIHSLLTQNRYHAVVAVGGDGTVNLVASLLVNTDIPLGILPLGSGNGLSKDLHIPQDLELALEVIGDFHVSAMDVLTINGIYSLHLSDLGFNALVVRRFSEGDMRGNAAYAWHAVKEYVDYQPSYYEIITPNEVFRGKAFMVTIANARTFGSNVTINPNGELNDGYFEICILEEFPKTAGIGVLYQMLNEGIQESLYVHIIKCTEATIINPDGACLQIDGEPVDLGQELDIQILPSSLKIIAPLPDFFEPL